MESMPRRKLYGKAIGMRLPQQVMEILERERKAFGLTYAELVRRAVVAYYMGIEPQPPRSAPAGPGVIAVKGAGLVGPENGGDAPQPSFVKEKTGEGEGG
jgi:hypothetical protein